MDSSSIRIYSSANEYCEEYLDLLMNYDDIYNDDIYSIYLHLKDGYSNKLQDRIEIIGSLLFLLGYRNIK